ncbi:hypothetical protein AB0P17_15480 [Streptomyces sp. NPDC088124]|uniref:hypothetical protein n=1 Tax=Streptomyces sp. NPDC088124 TaxID=3154654 RepID=UPI0034347B80
MEHWIAFWTALWVGSARISRRLVEWLLGIPKTATKTKTKKAETKTDAATESAEDAPDETEAEAGDQQRPAKKTTAKKPEPKSDQAAGGGIAVRLVCLLLACGFIKGLPYTTAIAQAFALGWLLLALILGYAATPAAAEADGSKADAKTDPKAAPHPCETLSPEYVTALLHAVYTTGSGVHLTTLAERLQVLHPEAVWRTRDVRSLLARVGVSTKAVRAGASNSPLEGVHRDDFPPLPGHPPVGVVAAGQTANNNTNNSDGEGPREGISIMKDPGHPTRYDVHHHDRPAV